MCYLFFKKIFLLSAELQSTADLPVRPETDGNHLGQKIQQMEISAVEANNLYQQGQGPIL